MSTIPIHTSDRITFKQCRRKWDLSSRIRQNLKPKAPAKALEFGTAIHAALEVYYEPNMWDADREMVNLLTVNEFRHVNNLQKKERGDELSEEDRIDFEERLELGIGMLENYFLWAPARDNFTPVMVEARFEVPVPGTVGHLYKAVYRGRLDMLVEDKDGLYWIVDHKTTARMEDNEPFLELDEQCGSYCWAIQEMLGVKVGGVIYNELYKGVPIEPAMNSSQRQGRWYSINRQQNTSYDLVLKTITEANEPLHLYEDYLNFLKAEGRMYFRRIQVHRSQEELQNLGRQIAEETADMLDPNLRIYPNPNKWNCKWCDYRLPCMAMNDGSDIEWIIKENYRLDS
jgi:hypothetical protein